MSDIGFDCLQVDSSSRARRGRLRTTHGPVQTPAFMPIGTLGAVKGILPAVIAELGAEMLLANTYHLMLRPGVEVVEQLGGLHGLMAWDRPILTDSGGYQVFSLSRLNRIDDEAVTFSSHIDGRRIELSPERATEIQNRLGADVIMCFDQCTAYPCEPSVLRDAVRRTLAWARRCHEAHANDRQMLFGIVQGGVDLALRRHCTEKLLELPFAGYAIGGLSVGEGHDLMTQVVEATTDWLPADRPRYLMGVGTPADILMAVRAGIDLFDCVLPTRNGRNAFAFTADGPLRLRNSEHTASTEPIEADCDCLACRCYSRGAIRHFIKCGEMLGAILVSIHNLRFYQRLMAEVRQRLENGTFGPWAGERLAHYRRCYH